MTQVLKNGPKKAEQQMCTVTEHGEVMSFQDRHVQIKIYKYLI